MATRRASIFEPIFSMTPAGGPTKITPASAQAFAKAGFSDRNP